MGEGVAHFATIETVSEAAIETVALARAVAVAKTMAKAAIVVTEVVVVVAVASADVMADAMTEAAVGETIAVVVSEAGVMLEVVAIVTNVTMSSLGSRNSLEAMGSSSLD